MTEPRYTIDRDVDRTRGVIRLRLTGEFDRTAHPALHRAVLGALAGPKSKNLVVDVAGTTPIDEDGVDALLAGYVAALRGGHGYRVINPRRRVRRALKPAGLLP